MLFWHLLTREQDYAFGRPAMTRNKIRKLELLAGARPQKGRKESPAANQRRSSTNERELSRQAEAAYRRSINRLDEPAAQRRVVRVRQGGAHLKRPSKGHSRATGYVSPKICSSLGQSPAPPKGSHQPQHPPLDFHPSVINRSIVIPCAA